MKQSIRIIIVLIFALGSSAGMTANTNDSTSVLFGLLNKGGCQHDCSLS